MDRMTFAERLMIGREDHSLGYQVKESAQALVQDLLALLFPQLCREHYASASEIAARLVLFERDLRTLATPFLEESGKDPGVTIEEVMGTLPVLHAQLQQDAKAIYLGDPAAESLDEVIVAYPGFLAIALYRIAHEFYKRDVPIMPRLLTEYAHQTTGIDIHPGANIGTPFAIDHGTGIVIGESTIIGSNVKVYQGVTLGALSVDKNMANSKRHPTIEDDVVIYAQAVILGGDTHVGHHSIIGGNVWLTESVPPYSFVYQEHNTVVRAQEAKRAASPITT